MDLCMMAGASEEWAYGHSIPECQRLIRTWAEREKRREKQIARWVHALPQLMNSALSGHYESLYDTFPGLFQEEHEQAEQQRAEAFAAKMKTFADQWNQKKIKE